MLFRQKYLCVLFAVMMFFVIASGGCGGGGSSNSNISNDNNNNPSPNNPDQDNPETKYDFSILEGTWKASNCTGIARSGDLTAEMSLSTTHNTITFTDVIVSGSTGTFEGTSDIILTIEGYTEWEDEFGGYKPYDIGGYEYQNTSGNTWRMERLNHEGETVRVTITFTSSITAKVEQFYETENGTVEYSYTLTKQSTATEYDISVLQGTWIASNGTARWVENGQTIDAILDEQDSGSYSFSEIQLSGDIATIFMGGETIWVREHGTHGMAYGIRARKFQNIDRNVWRYESSDGSHAYTITITSPTTADVEEEILEEQFTWTASYTLTKQSATTPDINGTWRIGDGSLTYQDNGTTRTLNYGGSSSTAQFTLTLSETGEGNYVINVSGAGVFKKEGSPYIKAKFEGILENVRVVWGSSEYRENFGGGTEYKRTDTGTYTYSAEFPSVIHDVSTASFRLSQPSRITYTQTGKSIERPDSYYEEHNTEEEPTVTVELHLVRVN